MRKIIQIAKLELSLLFYSPIAWLLMIVLFFQTAFVFVNMVGIAGLLQDLYHFPLSFLTGNVFCKPGGGILPELLTTLYLYIPLLTMGLISREASSGTIKLLYTSPIRIGEIVLGKFTAMLVYSLVLTAMIGLVLIGGGISIVNFDTPMILSALLGIFLLLGAYAAIGLFISTISHYQVVVAIGTFVVFAFLRYIGYLWQGIDLVRDLSYCLSMPGRTEKLIRGLVTTRDVLYFVIIMWMFLALSVYKLKMARDSRAVVYRTAVYLLIVASGLAGGYLSSRPRFIGYYDATATKLNTLTESTQDLLRKMGKEGLKITQYVNLLDATYLNGSPEKRLQDFDRWEPYIRFKPSIDLEYVYYYDSIRDPAFSKKYRGKTLEEIFQQNVEYRNVHPENFLSPGEIRKRIDLHGEDNRLVMDLEYKGKHCWLRVFDDADFWPGETEIAAALKRMLENAPEIMFVTDGYTRSIDKIGDRDYKILTNLKRFRYALINQGFAVDTLSLEKDIIPAGLAALVIADPKVEFSPTALGRVGKYIEAGGNLLLAGEPEKREVTRGLMGLMGVRMIDGVVVQRSKDFSFDLVTPKLTHSGIGLSKTLQPIVEDSIPMSMPGVTGLVYEARDGFSVEPLLVNDSAISWIKMGRLVLDSADLEYEPSHGDQRGSWSTGLALTRGGFGKEQRIVVTGDADWLSNKELGRANVGNCNFQFGNAVFGWFSYGAFPVAQVRPRGKDNRIRLHEQGMKVMKIVYLGVIPGTLLLLGAVLLIRRKRK